MEKTVITFILVFLTTFGFCQHSRYTIIGDTATSPDTAWLSRYEIKLLKDRKMVYKKPAGFVEVPGMECFENNQKLFILLGSLDNQLLSKDGHCIAFVTVYSLLTKQDSIEWRKLFPNGKFDIDNAYVNQISGKIKMAQGDSIAQGWRHYVTFYSARDAKREFNADTVIAFHLLDIDSSEYYKGKYKYLDALFLQKRERGFVNFYFFFDNEGKKNIKKYLRDIEGTLRYED